MAVLDLSIYRYLLLSLVVPVIVLACRCSYRLLCYPLSTLVACRACLSLIRFVPFVVDSIRFVCLVTSLLAVATTGHGGHLVRHARPPTSGGDDFLIGGDRLPKPVPSPFLRTRSKKMWFFSAKQGENGKNLRKRKRE